MFIVVRTKGNDEPDSGEPLIDQVGQIRFKSELIQAVEKAGMAEFDAGGKFLETHLYKDIVEEIGSPKDDFKNTFTGRMLLILESRPILGEVVYRSLKTDCINSYFGDFEGNEGEFVPYFLINDILRMWRTFCVNYEFFRKGTSDWRVKNLKLKYTRMITCYSALLYISATYRLRATVTPADIAQLSEFTPLERLEQFARGGMFEALPEIEALTSHAQKALGDYGEFLEFVQEKGAAIKALKKDESTWRKRSYEFGATVAQMLHMISGSDPLDNRVYRSILV